MVEVHLHGLVAHLFHYAHHAVALGVAHGHLRADEEDVLGQLAVHHEDVLGQVHNRVGDELAVAVLGFEREGHLLARLLAEDRLLELGQQHARAEDEFEGLSRTGLIGYLTVYGELVVHRYHFVVFCFHFRGLCIYKVQRY